MNNIQMADLQEKKAKLLKLLGGNENSERGGIVKECINSAKNEHIQIAYDAYLGEKSTKRIIYLLGGNDPKKCPFN